MDSLEMVHFIVQALRAKKAQDITVLDLRGLTIIADFFVIATGTSRVHVHALIDGVREALRDHDVKGMRPEGSEETGWALLDLKDVIIHIFDEEQRDFYQLERLWGAAPRLPLPEDAE